jgi:hypothetical protein
VQTLRLSDEQYPLWRTTLAVPTDASGHIAPFTYRFFLCRPASAAPDAAPVLSDALLVRESGAPRRFDDLSHAARASAVAHAVVVHCGDLRIPPTTVGTRCVCVCVCVCVCQFHS